MTDLRKKRMLRWGLVLLGLLAFGCKNTVQDEPGVTDILSDAQRLAVVEQFGFTTATNSGLSADVAVEVSGDDLVFTLPAGTDLSALVLSFPSGTALSLNGTALTSGSTAFDYTASPLEAVVTFADGTSKTYPVYVSVLTATQVSQVLEMAFKTTDNSALSADVSASLTDDALTFTVPSGTSLSALVLSFPSGMSVTAGGTTLTSSVTAYNYSSSPVSLSVTFADGTVKTLYVYVTTLTATQVNQVREMAFTASGNSALSSDVTPTLSGESLTFTLPSGTSLSALVLSFPSGMSINAGSTALTSGTTAYDYSSTVSLSVTFADGSTKTLSVTVSTSTSSTTSSSSTSTSSSSSSTSSSTTTTAGTRVDDLFGSAVSLSGDTLAVGASGEESNQTTITTTAATDDSITGAGAVYIYLRSGTTWALQAYIKPPNPGEYDSFGTRTSLNGDTLAVGVSNEDSNQTTITNGTTASSDDSAASSGAVYVYSRSGTTWTQQAYIKATNAGAGDGFGSSVSLSSDTLAVGAYAESSNQTTITNGTTASSDNSAATAGAVYVYKRTGTSWAQEAYIKAANAEASDLFGYELSLDTDTLAVTAYSEDSNQTTITNGTTASANNSTYSSGAAYVYKRTGSNWAQEAYIKAANAGSNDGFGRKVFLNGDTLAVGTYDEDSSQTTITNGTTASADNSATASGAVYVYKRTGSNWAQEAYIKAANAEASDWFGNAISLNGDTLAVGAQWEDSNQTTITNGTTASADNTASKAGAVYVYKRTGSNWAQEAYIKAANGETDDEFGSSVSVDTDTLAVGAYFEDSNQTTVTNGTTASADNSVSKSGAVYVYKRTGTSWAQEAYLK